MAEDQLLWNQLKQGNRKAFDAIYQNNVDGLYRYGFKFSQDESLIEDCLHDLFIYLWKNRAGLSSTDKIRPYLMTAFRNRIIKVVKQRQKMSSNELNEEIHFEMQTSKEADMIKSETDAENKKRLEATMKTLSNREREAIYLKYYQHLDTSEICSIMDINNQSFRNVLHSALKKMRKKF